MKIEQTNNSYLTKTQTYTMSITKTTEKSTELTTLISEAKIANF